MSDIIKSQGWNWDIVSGDFADVWKNPASEEFSHNPDCTDR